MEDGQNSLERNGSQVSFKQSENAFYQEQEEEEKLDEHDSDSYTYLMPSYMYLFD